MGNAQIIWKTCRVSTVFRFASTNRIHKFTAMSISTLVTQLFSAVQDFWVINIDFNTTDVVITHGALFKYVGGNV